MASKRSLEAAAATAGLFTQVEDDKPKAKAKRGRPKKVQPQPQHTPQTKPKTKPNTAAGMTNAKTPESKRETVTFSAKIDSEVSKKWRTYTTIDKYGDTGKLTEAALLEYMNRHKLTPEQQKKYDILTGI